MFLNCYWLRLPWHWNIIMLTLNGFCASKTPFPGVFSGLVTGFGLQHCKKSDLLSAKSPWLLQRSRHSTTRDGISLFCTLGGVFKMQLGRGMAVSYTSATAMSHTVQQSEQAWKTHWQVINLCKILEMLKHSLQTKAVCSFAWCNACPRPAPLLCLPCSTEWDLRSWLTCYTDTGGKLQVSHLVLFAKIFQWLQCYQSSKTQHRLISS